MKDHHSIKLLPSANTVNPIDIKREVMVRALKCHVLDGGLKCFAGRERRGLRKRRVKVDSKD